jgi:dienelactone hydrolase
MEMYYSSLTGEGLSAGSGLSPDEIEQRLNTYNGLTGYEPLPVLARSKTPTLWLFGERDIDIPARRSAMILRGLETRGAPFTIKVYPNGNHNLEDDATRKELSYWPDIVDWLRQRQVLNAPGR